MNVLGAIKVKNHGTHGPNLRIGSHALLEGNQSHWIGYGVIIDQPDAIRTFIKCVFDTYIATTAKPQITPGANKSCWKLERI